MERGGGGTNHTWPNRLGWPPSCPEPLPYLLRVRSWTGIGHTGSLIRSQKLRPAPGLLKPNMHLDVSSANPHALRHPQLHSGLRGSQAGRPGRLEGCFKELAYRRPWSAWAEPGQQGGGDLGSTWRPLPMGRAGAG